MLIHCGLLNRPQELRDMEGFQPRPDHCHQYLRLPGQSLDSTVSLPKDDADKHTHDMVKLKTFVWTGQSAELLEFASMLCRCPELADKSNEWAQLFKLMKVGGHVW